MILQMTRPMRRFRSPFLASLMLSSALVLSLPGMAVAQAGFTITVDGEHVAGDWRPRQEPRATDADLSQAAIQVTYDGLEATRRLQAGLVSAQARADGGVGLVFGLDTNYSAWITRAEIRVFGDTGTAPISVLPVTDGRAELILPASGDREIGFVARVYDRDGRYDETMLSMVALEELRAAGATGPHIIYGGDNTATRSIPVHGGTVTVAGSSLPAGSQVQVMGQTVPVDRSGRFAVERILPSGDHVVDIAIVNEGEAVTFRRDVNIPDSEWFYVGLADLTVGTRWGSGQIVAANPDEFDSIYYQGRLAFYLKGKIRGEYLLTAAADTGEGPLSEMFTGALSSDPQALLRRIDPNEYYPVYGDDSVLLDDAPTNGKFYVRLERGDSHVMWGNFRTEIGDSSLLHTRRTLYGASGHYQSDSVTAAGSAQHEMNVYFALPGTVPARDVLRGTGGSAYVLRRQAIAPGSEIVTIETVNAVTGMVTGTRTLRPGVDYSINYMQGLVILAQPLASNQLASGAVQSSQPDYVNLAVQYEYTPAGTDVEDYVFGGAGSVWLGDHVRLGAIGLGETSSTGDDLSVLGVNARVEADSATFIEAEILRSRGQGHAAWLSLDGGFTYVQDVIAPSVDEAWAYRVRAQADLSDLVEGSFAAVAGVTLEGREQGFSTLDQQTLHDTFSASAWLDLALAPEFALGFTLDHIENSRGMQRTEIGAEVEFEASDAVTVTAGVLHRVTETPGRGAPDTGNRTDLGLRVSYEPFDALTLSAFGQLTAFVSPGYARNDRAGLGAQWQLNEQWSVTAEGSAGTTGPQALAMVSHTAAAGERTYLGFRMAPDTSDDFVTRSRSLNGLVAGAERQLNDAVSVYAENTYGLFTDAGHLNAFYGINFTPDPAWTASVTYETGSVVDTRTGNLERHALSGALAYNENGIDWSSRAELRIEDSADNAFDRNTFLGQSGLSVQADDDWRLLAGVSALLSQSDQASILDGDYIEATIGAAYRPTENDRLNALIRYSYLYDLPGPDQVARGGGLLGPAQRSHIFSVDANYDVNEYLTIGGKYGFRIGEVSDTRLARDFEMSSAHLFILRADLGIITDWHLLVEARGLYQPETAIFSPGALAMISYDINDTVRLGAGYNFAGFTDDLRDLSLDNHGVFLNLSARF